MRTQAIYAALIATKGSGDTARRGQSAVRQIPSGSQPRQNAATACWCSARRIFEKAIESWWTAFRRRQAAVLLQRGSQ